MYTKQSRGEREFMHTVVKRSLFSCIQNRAELNVSEGVRVRQEVGTESQIYGTGSWARPTNPALRNPKMEAAESQDSTIFTVLHGDPTCTHQIAILPMHGQAHIHQGRRFAP